jgi:hypothetical protein
MFYSVSTLLLSVIFFVIPVVSAAEALSVQSVSNSTPTVGDPITIAMTLSQGAASQLYYLKCRIGEDSTHLTDGQTYNATSGVWLEDSGANGAWILMPQVETDATGAWSGALVCRVKATAASSTKYVYVRACLNSDGSCDSSFQSGDYQDIQVLAPPPTATPLPSPTPTTKPSPTASPQPTVLKTPTPVPTHTSKPAATRVPSPAVPTERVLTVINKETQMDNELFAIPDTREASDTVNRILSSATDSGLAEVSVTPESNTVKRIAGILLVVALVFALTAVAFVWNKRSSV